MNKQELKHLIKEIITELTYKDLVNKSKDGFLDAPRKSRATPGAQYKGITSDGIVTFTTPSYDNTGTTYTQTIKLMDFQKYIDEFSSTLQPIEIVRKIIAGNIKVHCTDPSWKYWGYQYKGTKEDYALEPEERAPVKRNPKLSGSVCKHILNILFILPMSAPRITSDLMKLGIFKRKAERSKVPISSNPNEEEI